MLGTHHKLSRRTVLAGTTVALAPLASAAIAGRVADASAMPTSLDHDAGLVRLVADLRDTRRMSCGVALACEITADRLEALLYPSIATPDRLGEERRTFARCGLLESNDEWLASLERLAGAS